MVIPLMIANEFVVSSKDREQKKLAKLSFTRLKEELAYRCDPTLKQALAVTQLLARYQQMVITHNLSTTILNNVASLQSTLADMMLILVNGVSDLAHDGRDTSFGKAGKKELKVYCDCCYELELLLEDIHRTLNNCLHIDKVDECKKSCQKIADKIPTWQQEITAKSHKFSTI